MTWDKWINAILGLWVATSPFVGLTEAASQANLVVTGIVILAVSIAGSVTVGQERRAHA